MADLFNYVQGKPSYSLVGNGVSSSATSITVSDFTLPDGTNITMSMFGDTGYGTFEPGTAREENISFTGVTQNGNGTATLTGVTRGLRFVAPYTADSGLAKGHGGNTPFVLSNSAPFYNELSGKDNDETITGTWTFASGEIYLGDAVPDPAGIRINDVTNQMEFRRGNTGWSTIPTQLRGVYPNFASLPPTGNAEGDIAVTSDDSKLYVWDSSLSTWVLAGGSSGAGTVYKTVKLGSESSGGDLKTFVLDSGSWPDEKFLLVYKNGLIMENDASGDYQTITTNTIEFTYTVLPTDKIVMVVISVDLYNPEWVNVNTDLLPDVDATHDIGSSSLQFKDIHFSGDIYQDGVAATSTSTADAIVRADGSGKIDADWISYVSIFGTGEDGDVTISTNTSLTRDMYYNNLTVDDGVTLNPNGFRIFVAGTLDTNSTGKIASNGGNGGNGANFNSGGGSTAAGGTAGAAAYTTGSLPIPKAGKAGANGIDSNNGVNGTAGDNATYSIINTSGGAGGDGGQDGIGTEGSGGAGGTVTSQTISPPYSSFAAFALSQIVAGTLSQSDIIPGSGSGGSGTGAGGSNFTGGAGGGSGATGGLVWIFAKNIVTLTAEAIGGNGGDGGDGRNGTPDTAGGGGGAGGNGGLILLNYISSTTINTDVSGGTGGTGGTGGAGAPSNGQDGEGGNDGLVIDLS